MLTTSSAGTIALALFLAQAPKEGPDPKKDQPRPSSRISDANYRKLSRGMSEAEVLAILGPVDRKAGRGQGVTGWIWEDANRVRVEFKDGKVSNLEGHFDHRVRSRSVNEANFKKLKIGMSREEVDKILAGRPGLSYDGDKYTYEHRNAIEVQFKDGRVTGQVMSRGIEK